MTFGKLLRFTTATGNVFYGEAEGVENLTKEGLIGTSIPVYAAGEPWDDDFTLTSTHEVVDQVLCPLERVPMFLCVGLNYKQHIQEAGLPTTEYPTIFTKPPDALAGPFQDISVNPECKMMDYEAELCVVLGKDCKNVGATEDVSQYILGYTAGNDVSSRWWQMPERSGNQHGPSKSFDGFAPIGPTIVSSKIITDPGKLRMTCKVNDRQRQNTLINDMLFDIPAIIRHLSRGATLRKGTVIMTGTSSGVAAFMKPPEWLKDGDTMEVQIDEIGSIKNRIVMEK